MRILLTGCAGFIGFHLAKYILKNSDPGDIELHLIDNFCRQKRDSKFDEILSNKNVLLHEGDLTDKKFVSQLPNNFETIYHLAALNGTENFYESPDKVLLSSTIPALLLLEKYCLINSFKNFVYSGSSESYATGVAKGFVTIPTQENVILSIESPLNPRWSYSISKTHGEVATVSFCNKFKKNWQILRLHNIIGIRMGDKHFIPDFMSRIKENKFELYGWDDTRSFLSVSDAALAIHNLKNNNNALNKIINIGSDEEVKIIDVANMILKTIGKNKKIMLYDSPQGSVKRRVPDIKLLKSFIPNFPFTSIDEEIKNMAVEYKLI